jgi:hypothetical protein
VIDVQKVEQAGNLTLQEVVATNHGAKKNISAS